jgi:cell division GTPase FtsZ
LALYNIELQSWKDKYEEQKIEFDVGKAMMGTGEASGEDRALQAAEKAIANPLLDEISLKGATGVLINVTGSSDMTLFEVDEAANRIRDEVDPEANIIVGSTFDSDLTGSIRVSVVATGIDVSEFSKPRNQVTEEPQISEKSNLQDYFAQNISTENEINRKEVSIDQEAMLQENRELDTIKGNQNSMIQAVQENQQSSENRENEVELESQPLKHKGV